MQRQSFALGSWAWPTVVWSARNQPGRRRATVEVRRLVATLSISAKDHRTGRCDRSHKRDPISQVDPAMSLGPIGVPEKVDRSTRTSWELSERSLVWPLYAKQSLRQFIASPLANGSEVLGAGLHLCCRSRIPKQSGLVFPISSGMHGRRDSTEEKLRRTA
jgi:hypothetical protein